MSGLVSRARAAAQVLRDVVRAHVRTILPVGAVVLVGVVVLALLSGAYAQLIGATAYEAIVASVTSMESLTVAITLVLLPLILLALLASLVWAGVAAQAASAAVDRRRASMPRAAAAAFRRIPSALAVIVVALLAVLAAILTAPLLVIAGVIGLLVTRGAEHPRLAGRDVSRGTLVAMAIPFGVAVLALVRWSLALPAVWLDGLRMRAALAESSSRVRGRGPEVGAVLLIALVASFGLSELAVAAIGTLGGGPTVDLVVRIGALILLGALPFIAAAVLYRDASVARPERLPAPSSRRLKVAATLVFALTLPLMVTVAPSPARAAADATVTLEADRSDSVFGEQVVLKATVAGDNPSDGTMTFQVIPEAGAPVDLGSGIVDGSHWAYLFTDDIPAGDVELVAHYSGDSRNSAATSDPLAFTVHKATVSIGVSSSTPTSGDTTTLTIALTAVAPGAGTPSGTITVSAGGDELGSPTLNGSGVATLPIDVAAAGTRELTIDYSGDAGFASDSRGYTVPRIATTIHVFTPSERDLVHTYGDSQTYEGVVATNTGTVPTGTVQLFWGSVVREEAELVAGGFSITTDELRTGDDKVWLYYTGDASHAPGDNDTTDHRIDLEVKKAQSDPVLSIDPLAEPAIGGYTTVYADMADLGAGATGTVTFRDSLGTFYGTFPVTNGRASVDILLTHPNTFLTGEYSGDINFTSGTSPVFTITATRAAVDVTIEDPGVVAYGEVFDLVADVAVAGGALPADHGVDFATVSGPDFAEDVPVIGGKATVEVCAGIAADCPSGVPALGSAELDIVARYAESSTNLLGESAPWTYTAGKAVTTTTLVVDPMTILFGSAVVLTATVDAPSSGATPTGSVSFYGVMPVEGGGTSLAYLGTADLDGDGVARLETQSGTGGDDLLWPAGGIRAIYYAEGALFRASQTDVAISIERIGTTVVASVPGTPTPAGSPTTITVNLSHDPGASAAFTGKVTVTADTGQTCVVFLTGSSVVSCSITWAAVGAHSVTATYSGDLVYKPGTSDPVTVSIGKPTPSLGASAPTDVLVDQDVTVTWNQFSATATGTVTVWGDGNLWCDAVSVQALSCTGRFGNASATGGLVDVVVRYSGDSDWNGVEQVLTARVTRCAILDVRSTDSSLGTVRVDSAPNCGASGYLPGTSVTVTALPIAPAVFVHWLKYTATSPGLVAGATSATTSFTVTLDTATWVHVAKFRIPCFPVTASATGFGDIFIYPSTNCTTDAGVAGYLHGTKVSISPLPQLNPTYEERDEFRSWGALPAGATSGVDSTGYPTLTLTVVGPVVVPLTFGPRCRPVEVRFDPATEGDTAEFTTEHNCFSASGDGYLRGTAVTASVHPGDPTLAISGWTLNGAPAPELGTTSQPTVEVGGVVPVLTASVVHCYLVDVKLDGAQVRYGKEVGQVRVEPAANCPDGSARYLTGTEVTLTPEIVVAGGAFNGWDENRTGNVVAADGVGDVPQGIRKVVLEADLHTTAGFFLEEACSRLIQLGDPSLLAFHDTGCGEGYYQDRQKWVAFENNEPQESFWQMKNRTTLTADVNRRQKLDVYVSVQGDIRGCFGTVPTSEGPSDVDPGTWQTFGPLRGDTADCPIGGPAAFWAQACQTIVTNAVLHVGGATYGARESLPGTFYLPDSDGVIHPFTMDGFDWAQPIPVSVLADGRIERDGVRSGPCKDVGDAFPAKTDFVLIAAGPSTGFVFQNWSDLPQGSLAQNPILRKTDDTQRTLPATAHYEVTCHTVTLGEGIMIEGDAPRCPGSSESDNSFIAGTAIQVKAVQHIGSRIFEKFTSGVVGGQIYEDPDTKDVTGFAFVDADKHVAGYYPTSGQRFTNGFIQGLKFTTGIAAVAAPIFFGMLFPPAGILFGVLGAGAGIAALIPGGEKLAAALDLVNPTKITTCIANWSYGNAGEVTGGKNIGSMISTANTIRKVVNGVDVLFEPVGPIGATGGALSFGYGLYDAGIGDNDWTPQTVEDLADEQTLTTCLNQQWRAAGAQVGGPDAVPQG